MSIVVRLLRVRSDSSKLTLKSVDSSLTLWAKDSTDVIIDSSKLGLNLYEFDLINSPLAYTNEFGPY